MNIKHEFGFNIPLGIGTTKQASGLCDIGLSDTTIPGGFISFQVNQTADNTDPIVADVSLLFTTIASAVNLRDSIDRVIALMDEESNQ